MESIGKNQIPLISFLGRATISLVNNMGAMFIFLVKSLLMIFQPKQLPLIIEQVHHIGARSSNIADEVLSQFHNNAYKKNFLSPII